MNRLIRTVASLAIVTTLAACGSSSASSSNSPSTAPTTAATTAPTIDGGGGGAGGGVGSTANGTLHFDVSGATTKSGDLGGTPNPLTKYEYDGPGTAYLVFSSADGETAIFLTIAKTADGTTLVYGDGDLGISPIPFTPGVVGKCDVKTDQLDASTARGTFDCTDMTASQGDVSVGIVRIKGTFDSHK